MACRLATPVLIGESFGHNHDFGSFRLISFDKEKETALFIKEEEAYPRDDRPMFSRGPKEYGWREMIPEVYPYKVFV